MVSYRQPGTLLTDRHFTVPLDHSEPDGPQIELFAREVVATGPQSGGLPWLVFLQGGPGFGAPRPVGREGWLDRALRDYRVLLLDQRGTGGSSPVNRHTLAGLGSAAAQADYLAHFRADAIVADAELVRGQVTGGQPWAVLGQSYGGFCAVTYLSRAPEGISEAFITGGLPGLRVTAEQVYRRTYPMVAARSRAHYERYPEDIGRAKAVARRLAQAPARLPSGGTLTVEAFQFLGRMLGASTGSHQLHYLLEYPFAGHELGDDFLQQVQSHVSFAAGPIYGLLHEACYAQGGATGWSAQRVRAEFSEFDPAAALDSDEPLLFTGEMIYPWMFQADPVLAPLQEAAELLAHRDGWPALYDQDRLAACHVPGGAAVYFNDMYVPTEFSLQTAATIPGLRPWVTSEYEHDGLRVSSGGVLDRLIALARGNA
jgi:pimeloyl-ACP methyl ester carboxylesterase